MQTQFHIIQKCDYILSHVGRLYLYNMLAFQKLPRIGNQLVRHCDIQVLEHSCGVRIQIIDIVLFRLNNGCVLRAPGRYYDCGDHISCMASEFSLRMIGELPWIYLDCVQISSPGVHSIVGCKYRTDDCQELLRGWPLTRIHR